MATREENLKKLNDELEKLSDEQLEQVAGGIKSGLGRHRPRPTIPRRPKNTDDYQPDDDQPELA